MNNDTHDDSNPHSPRKLAVRDLHHDAQLLRDLALINARTAAELGPLPAGGLPVKPKRKPKLPPVAAPAASSMPAPLPAPARKPEDDPMKLRQVAAAAMVPLAVVAAGCSTSHGDPMNPKKNPHPVKRYEVTATTDAPGSWDSVKGVVFFQVINKGCVPKDSFTGGQNVPNISYEFEMTRIENNTWKGFVYRDFLEDEDYFGLGICHWGVTQASPKFTVHGSNFVLGSDLESVKPYIEYFKKSDFLNHSLTDAGYPTTSADPEVTQDPVNFFPISVTVKEVAL